MSSHGFCISAMLSTRGRAYLPENGDQGQMCTTECKKVIFISLV